MSGTVVAGSARAMACDVNIHVAASVGGSEVEDAVQRALGVFHTVHRVCTRFDPSSPLMRANAHPDRWHAVPQVLFDAVTEAHRAYVSSRGRFDPRVIGDLTRLGYDHSLGFEQGSVVTAGSPARQRPRAPWRPRLRGGPRPELHLGGYPIDLGGIGKGLALRWAGAMLSATVDGFLIDAGGDCLCHGHGPEGERWSVGVEHPDDPSVPAAVLGVADVAVATSSVRLRRWQAGAKPVHHLIDPRTGCPGGSGLASVTVVGDDPARAEVATKALFLAGARGIAEAARRHRTAALWIGTDGTLATSRAMDAHVVWRCG